MREIVLDTETTGLDPASGHRLVEIACLELVNHLPSGRHFQRYLNPDRDMPEDAFAVHGLSAVFLADKPRFHEVAQELLAFIDGAPLVIHNAEFDMRFLNAELAQAGLPVLEGSLAVDTLQMARRVKAAIESRLGIRVVALPEGALLSVWDSGPGIPDQQEMRVFEPFAAAHSSKGGGLGLAICAEIADSMHAELTLCNCGTAGAVTGLEARVHFASRLAAPTDQAS